jgi:thiamine pyrophosphokinase
MSSHHIVREKQEPALLIVNLDGFNDEYLGQLLEWSPTVIVTDTMIDEVLSLGIKIDAVLENKDYNISDQQEHILRIPYSLDALDKGLKHFVGEGYPAVNVINNSFEFKEYQFYVDLIDIVVFIEERKIYPIPSGFSKWQRANEEIAILHPEYIDDLSFAGLEHIKENIYRTQKDGFFSFTFSQPYIFIAEYI